MSSSFCGPDSQEMQHYLSRPPLKTKAAQPDPLGLGGPDATKPEFCTRQKALSNAPAAAAEASASLGFT